MSNEKKISLMFDLEQVSNDVLVKCNQISQSIRDEAMEDIKANVLEPDNPESRSIINRSVTEAFGKVKTFCQRYLKQGRTVDNNVLERMLRSVTYVKVQDQDSQGHLLYDCTVSEVQKVVYKTPLYTCTVSEVSKTVYTLDNGNTWKDNSNDATVVPDAAPTLTENTIWTDGRAKVTPDDTPEPRMVDSDEIDTMEYETISLDLYIPNFNVSVTDDLKSNIHKYVVDYIMSRFLQDQLADKAKEYKDLADGEDRSNIILDLNARESFKFRKPSWV